MSELFAQPSFWLVGLAAVICTGLSKGGFSGLAVLSTPILSLAIPPLQAAAIMLPVLIVQDLLGIWSFRREYDREGLVVLFAGCVIGTVFSAVFAAAVPTAAITLTLGLIALVFGGQWWLRRWRGEAEEAPRRAATPVGVFWGAICGVTSFIAHAGTPPAQVYLMPLKLAPAIFAGTMTWLFFALNVMKLLPYFALGMFTRNTLTASALFAPIAALAMLAGITLVRVVPADRFYPIIYALLAAAGLKLTWDGLSALV